MKKTLTATCGLLLLVASNAIAEQYKAPNIQLSKHPASDGGMKKEGWSNDYKVKEKEEVERDLASDDDSDYKGNSDALDLTKTQKTYQGSIVKPWHFEKKHNVDDD